MWIKHGDNGPAIRLSIDRETFCRHIAVTHQISHSQVTYAGVVSSVHTGFSPRWGLSPAHDEIRFFFFQKRAHYIWEREFRVILESSDGVDIPINPDIIQQVTMSPLGKINFKLLQRLQDRFRDRLIDQRERSRRNESGLNSFLRHSVLLRDLPNSSVKEFRFDPLTSLADPV